MKNILIIILLAACAPLLPAADALMTSGGQTVATDNGSLYIDATPLRGLHFSLSESDGAPDLGSAWAFINRGGSDDFALGTVGDSSVWLCWNNSPVFGRKAGGGLFIDHDGTDNPYDADIELRPDKLAVRVPIDLPERTQPPSPLANTARIFSRDDGSGKTQLCVIFPTGAIQVLATQP